uniref:DUF4757 domain-containing protein n=1 Tax=Caenorhabditis japonica TaxID=281687 RepID=A0A8R1E065_CAEJA
MLRGPGQKCADPFQFIAAGKGGEDMAVSAKSTLQLAQQQKEQREKMLQKQSQKFDEGEPWQADLDTWRRKRKEKFGDRAATDSADTAHRVERNEEFHSYQPRKTARLATRPHLENAVSDSGAAPNPKRPNPKWYESALRPNPKPPEFEVVRIFVTLPIRALRIRAVSDSGAVRIRTTSDSGASDLGLHRDSAATQLAAWRG